MHKTGWGWTKAESQIGRISSCIWYVVLFLHLGWAFQRELISLFPSVGTKQRPCLGRIRRTTGRCWPGIWLRGISPLPHDLFLKELWSLSELSLTGHDFGMFYYFSIDLMSKSHTNCGWWLLVQYRCGIVHFAFGFVQEQPCTELVNYMI